MRNKNTLHTSAFFMAKLATAFAVAGILAACSDDSSSGPESQPDSSATLDGSVTSTDSTSSPTSSVTLSSSSVEMKEEVGDENIFIFGLTVEEVTDLLAKGYRPRDFYEKDDDLRRVIDLIGSGFFSPDRPDLFKHIADKLLTHDPYMLCADFRSYVDMQVKVAKEYQNKKTWAEKAILKPPLEDTSASRVSLGTVKK